MQKQFKKIRGCRLLKRSFIYGTKSCNSRVTCKGKNYKEILNDNIKIIRKENEKIDFDYYENALFKELNSLRKEISKKENIAPYIIFSDMTLIEMAEKKPRNRWDMLKIKGIGNQKFKSYGEKFLERINNYCMEERI